MKTSLVKVMAAAIIAATVGVAFSASGAAAAPKCANRYFKKHKVKSTDTAEDKAKAAYTKGIPDEAAKFKSDCDNCECEDEGEVCTFLYTFKKKPSCKQNNEKTLWVCTGWIRPGCFCLDPDEGI